MKTVIHTSLLLIKVYSISLDVIPVIYWMALLCLNLFILYADFRKTKKNPLVIHNYPGVCWTTDGPWKIIVIFALVYLVDKWCDSILSAGWPHLYFEGGIRISVFAVNSGACGCSNHGWLHTSNSLLNVLCGWRPAGAFLRPRLVSPGVEEAPSNDRRLAVRQQAANMSPLLWVCSATEALWTISRM